MKKLASTVWDTFPHSLRFGYDIRYTFQKPSSTGLRRPSQKTPGRSSPPRELVSTTALKTRRDYPLSRPSCCAPRRADALPVRRARQSAHVRVRRVQRRRLVRPQLPDLRRASFIFKTKGLRGLFATRKKNARFFVLEQSARQQGLGTQSISLEDISLRQSTFERRPRRKTYHRRSPRARARSFSSCGTYFEKRRRRLPDLHLALRESVAARRALEKRNSFEERKATNRRRRRPQTTLASLRTSARAKEKKREKKYIYIYISSSHSAGIYYTSSFGLEEGHVSPVMGEV